MNSKRSKWILAGGALLAVTVFVGVYGVSVVQASTGLGSASGPRVVAHPGIGDGTIDMQALLAEELGISVEELGTAQQAAFEAAIEVAVEEGRLAPEQADQMLEHGGFSGKGSGSRGFGMRGVGMHGFGPGGPEGESSYHSLLAAELDITVAELQAAQQSANEAAMKQLVDEGVLSEEQLENAEAAAALRAYLQESALLAEVLGMSSADLEAAEDAGKSLPEILEEAGMDAATFRENIAATMEAAIDEAVAEGILTQAQAEALDGSRPFGFGPGRGFCSGSGGFRGALPEDLEPGEGFGPGRGRFHGGNPFGPPSTPQEDTRNTTNA